MVNTAWLPTSVRGRLPERRDFVVRHLPRGGTGVEIGVWRGDFSQRLLRGAHPQLLHLVDPWTFAASYPQAWYGGAHAYNQADMDAICRAVTRRFADRPEVRIHRQTSLEAADSFAASSLDWVYVDGDHTFAAVLADLRGYFPLVRVGGVLAGDDFGVQGWWQDGVTRAVHAFVREHADVRLESIHAGQFVMRRTGPTLTG
jgi:hypothetical protein